MKKFTLKKANYYMMIILIALTFVFTIVQFGILMNIDFISTVFLNITGGFTILKGNVLITYLIMVTFLVFTILRLTNLRVNGYRLVGVVAFFYFLIAAIINLVSYNSIMSIVYAVLNTIICLIAYRASR